mmetsp:Transcript_11165/g.21397  ORF Transcript_11165/g.21397 Transcript_11165/m.21397 type:complete len:261 (-) Transcript_11165:404-1186(-)|eukprot:CAMPEP_0170198602 /NCGR_PEP_ID=MMETSP0040_2-20121228/68867_1 /TAXON_ID=641309 /ORGANISM="Lotharella oceanica, Strain CCMP622" /LENGTH=260 /DNA_ID=CAMNT_0010448619 /DNA_START=106 /DNA_END=888 /DNA_ORIENTATION=-
MGNKGSKRLKYTGQWRKGKHFDEKQRLLFESGSEDKGKVEMYIDLFNREFQLHLRYTHTQWFSKEEYPSGRIDVLCSRVKAKGNLLILPDQHSKRRHRTKIGQDNAGIAVECMFNEVTVRSFTPTWMPRLNIIGNRKKSRFRVLTETDVRRLFVGLLGIRVGDHTIPELAETITSYLPHTFWFKCGRIHYKLARDTLTFTLDLKKGNKVDKTQAAETATIIPIPNSAKALVSYLERSCSAADDHMTPYRCTDPQTDQLPP